MNRPLKRLGMALACTVSLVACKGDGFDIGPKLEKLPDESFRALVRDDAGRAVVNARATILAHPGAVVRTRRDGLADWYLRLDGGHVVSIETTGATARQGDLLLGLRYAFDAVASDQLLPVIHLVDVGDSVTLQLDAGPLAAQATLAALSGARFDLPAGTSIDFGGAVRETLRMGELRHDHLPPLRLVDGRPALVSRGVQLHPTTTTFAPGIHLTLPNDLGLAAGAPADLYELDPSDGTWRVLGRGEANGAATEITTIAPVVTRASLLAFAVAAPAVAGFRGRLLESDGLRAIARARVRSNQVVVETDSEGRFELSGVPVVSASGAARPASIAFTGGRTHRPATIERSFDAVSGQLLDVGSLSLDIEGVADLRTLALARGDLQAFVTVGIGSVEHGNGAMGVTLADGTIDFPAIDDRYVGFLATVPDPKDVRRVFSLDGRVFVPSGRRNLDLPLFFATEPWTSDNSGGAVVIPVDAETGSRLADVYIHRRRANTDEFIEKTFADQEFRAEIAGATEVVASLESSGAGRRIVSAHSADHIDVRRVELPLLRVQRAPIGAFEPFGVLYGDLRSPFQPGSGIPLATQWRARVTGVENTDRWLDAALADRSLAPATPVELDPGLSNGSEFRIGLPSRGAHVSFAWGDYVGGRLEVHALAPLFGVVLAAGTELRYVPNGRSVLPCNHEFVARGALAGLDASIPPTALRTELAYALGDGRAIEVLRGHDGNLSASGQDAVLRLPPLSPFSSSFHWLAVIGGQTDVGGVVRTQRAVFALDGTDGPANPQLALPEIVTPLHGQQVGVAGFEVRFVAPQGTLYVLLHLRGESAGELRDWKAIVQPELGSFTFRRLPSGPAVLAPGDYTLEVTAVRIGDGPVHQQFFPAYQAAASRLVGIGAWERRLDALASVRIAVQIVP